MTGLRTAAVLLASLVSGFVVAVGTASVAAGWGLAVPLSVSTADASGSAFSPDVAMDAFGNAIAVWSQKYGTWESILSSRYVPGSGWGAPELVELRNFGAFTPRVGVDALGYAIAVWAQLGDTTIDIWANRYVPGAGWRAEVLIERNDTGDAIVPQVAVNAAGHAAAAWQHWDGTRWQIRANVYSLGVGWGLESVIATNNPLGAFGPAVAMDAGGNATVVWHQWDPDGSAISIWANRYVTGAGWGTAGAIESGPGVEALYPDIAVDGAGDVIVVWHQGGYWASRYVDGTGWDAPVQIGPGNPVLVVGPRTAVNKAGVAFAVWDAWKDMDKGVWANRYLPGSGWGTLERIDSFGGLPHLPHVAVDEAGNAIAVWHEDGDIYARHFVAGVGWGQAQVIETNRGNADHPRVAVDQGGNAIAVWDYSDGVRSTVWANRYVAPDTTPPILILTGPPDGMRTNSSTVTVAGRTEPGAQLSVNGLAVSVAPDGSFSAQVALREGTNIITTVATDAAGNRATASVTVTYENPLQGLRDELQDARDTLAALRRELAESRTLTLLGLTALAGALVLMEILRHRRARRDKGQSSSPPKEGDELSPRT